MLFDGICHFVHFIKINVHKCKKNACYAWRNPRSHEMKAPLLLNITMLDISRLDIKKSDIFLESYNIGSKF